MGVNKFWLVWFFFGFVGVRLDMMSEIERYRDGNRKKNYRATANLWRDAWWMDALAPGVR